MNYFLTKMSNHGKTSTVSIVDGILNRMSGPVQYSWQSHFLQMKTSALPIAFVG